jgi:two-component sensor histidine kinase
MDALDHTKALASIRRKLDTFGATLPAGSAGLQAWMEVRTAVDDGLAEVYAERERLSYELREAKHQRGNFLQTASNVLETAKRDSGTIEEFESKLTDWVGAQGQALRGRTYDDGGLALIKPMLEYLLNPGRYRITEDRRRLDGLPGVLPAATIRIVTLLIDELAMNASKHGAFRQDGGHVDINWRVEGTGDSGVLVLEWDETCTSEIEPPVAWGIGYAGITREMPKIFGFEVEESHNNKGVHYAFRIPHESVAMPDKPRILVVDDWPDIYHLLDLMSDDLRIVVDNAASIEEAFNALRDGPRPDFVLVDRQIGDQDGFHAADQLAIRGIPFAFLCGLADGDWGRYAHALRIEKPILAKELPDLLNAILTSPYARCLK